MKSLLRKLLSLRVSLLFFMLLSWLVPTILLGTFMGTRFFQALQEKTEAALITGAEHAQANTIENITNLISLAKSAVYDEELTTAVNSFETGKINDEAYFRLCRGYLERKYGRENLCDFALFYRISDPATIFYTSDHYQDATYFTDYVQPTMLKLSKTLDTRCMFYEQQGRIYLARNLFNSRLELYGMLLLGVNTDQLFAPIYAWSAQWSFNYGLQLDTYQVGDMAYMSRTDGLSDQDGLLLYTLSAETRDYQFRFQVQASKTEVYHEMDVFRRLMVGIFILVVPLCLIIMVFVNRRIARPVDILCEASSRIQSGELGITVPIHGEDELGRLGNAFSNMSVQLKTLVDQSYKAEIAVRDARIQAMQSRINPHFINNALETINWQARIEESETISAMIEALSLLLNASMDRDGRHLVPLREELTIADAYFYFVGLRFGDRLSVLKSVQAGLENHLIPRLVIQTLLENAIQHGIEPAGGGRIHINIFSQDSRLVLEVTNNGNALTAEGRNLISELLKGEVINGNHLGLNNVSRRLHLLYGGDASMEIDSKSNGETVAVIRVPEQVEDPEFRLIE